MILASVAEYRRADRHHSAICRKKGTLGRQTDAQTTAITTTATATSTATTATTADIPDGMACRGFEPHAFKPWSSQPNDFKMHWRWGDSSVG